jgi:phenylpyruvate tautomerase PptA (4-oxalocrotonate tautomerase family)
MPFARISLLAGKSPDYLKAISESLQQAFVDNFEVPEKDRFQVFHQLQPGELVFDRDYRGGPRSDDFIHIHITTGKPRTLEVKQRFYRRVVELLARAPGIRPADVMIIIANSTFEDWSFASGICAATPSEAVA